MVPVMIKMSQEINVREFLRKMSQIWKKTINWKTDIETLAIARFVRTGKALINCKFIFQIFLQTRRNHLQIDGALDGSPVQSRVTEITAISYSIVTIATTTECEWNLWLRGDRFVVVTVENILSNAIQSLLESWLTLTLSSISVLCDVCTRNISRNIYTCVIFKEIGVKKTLSVRNYLLLLEINKFWFKTVSVQCVMTNSWQKLEWCQKCA